MQPDSGFSQGPVCPDAGNVEIHCYNIGGRATAGCDVPLCAPGGTLGEALASRARLEAISALAFERLQRELRDHGAPGRLVDGARRARVDELRHARMQARLARRFGSEPRIAEPPPSIATRSLYEVARENAVEGCVRETYGAVVGLIEARRSRDPRFRRTSRAIAMDECRHAELAWAVHAWAMRRLSEGERIRVKAAMQAAILEIAAHDPRVAGPLFRAVRAVQPGRSLKSLC